MIRVVLVLVGLLATACCPSLEEEGYLLTEERILAIRGIPAEARPNTPVRYEVLIAAPDGTQEVEFRLAYCTEPRSADERTGVSAACLQGQALQAVEVETELLSDACARFGPNTPPTQEGMRPRRPADPDPTGGYYLPVQVTREDNASLQSFGFHRVRCDLAGATRDIFDAYQERYLENRHPQIAALFAQQGSETHDLLVDPMRVATGQSVLLAAQARADSFEDFVVYSAEDAKLFDRKERLTLNWYFTSGQLEVSQQSLDPALLETKNEWRAPDSAGPVHGWLVLRDDRGGAAWSEFLIEVD
jgi:hypothetical protein